MNMKSSLLRCYGPNQHAYRPLSSTTTALVEICDRITRGLDLNDVSHVNVFCLDLSKAFDKLQHNRLLNYLNTQGLNHGFLRWLHSYLQARPFRVKILNNFGPPSISHSGVPQGSVLGPYLFAAYMGSFSFDPQNVFTTKYADDVTIIEWVYRNTLSSITLSDCTSLFNHGGLFLNESKCKQLCIRRSQIDFLLSDTGFSDADIVKVLGFRICKNLTWNAQISEVLKLAARRLYMIRCLKKCLSSQELIRVYHAVITSLILYASPAYGRLPTTLLMRLEKFQNRGHRLICGPSCECDGFPSLGQRIEDAAVKFLRIAESYHDHPLHNDVPGRLPATNRMRLPFCNTTRRLNSFFPWAARVANSKF